MALYDSANLLGTFNRKAGRPAADAITDASKYERLSESQNRVIAELSAVAPRALYPKVTNSGLPTLATSDGQIFTFGTDSNGYPVFPMGHGGIYSSLADIPDRPMTEGVDYLNEGNQIRMLPIGATYGGTLYWYGVAQPADISASSEPAIIPEPARELIVIDAVRQFAVEFNRQSDLAALMAAEWALAWPKWCLVWKTQFQSGGALRLHRITGGGVVVSSGSSGTGANDGYWNSDYFG